MTMHFNKQSITNGDGYHKLTRKQVHSMLRRKRGIVAIDCLECGPDGHEYSFAIRKDGTLRIGCQKFTAQQVGKMRAWVTEGR